jgi:hypothetical protein
LKDYFNDGKGNFGAGIQFQKPETLPNSLIAEDLNADGRPNLRNGSRRPQRRWAARFGGGAE